MKRKKMNVREIFERQLALDKALIARLPPHVASLTSQWKQKMQSLLRKPTLKDILKPTLEDINKQRLNCLGIDLVFNYQCLDLYTLMRQLTGCEPSQPEVSKRNAVEVKLNLLVESLLIENSLVTGSRPRQKTDVKFQQSNRENWLELKELRYDLGSQEYAAFVQANTYSPRPAHGFHKANSQCDQPPVVALR